MRLEYLLDGSPDCPLLRLFDFTPSEANRLGTAIADLAAGRAEMVTIHKLPDVTAVGGSELVMVAKGWDLAVVRVGPLSFECGFTKQTWANVVGLIQPFTATAGGYQWLAGVQGEASLLLSVSRKW